MSGTTYYFSVQAKNNAGLWSDIGVTDGITYDGKAPPTPSAPQDEGKYKNSTVLTWIWEPVTDLVFRYFRYYIAIGLTPDGTEIGEFWITINSFTYTLAIDGKTYYARVRAKDNAGRVSGYSLSSDGIFVDLLSSLTATMLLPKNGY